MNREEIISYLDYKINSFKNLVNYYQKLQLNTKKKKLNKYYNDKEIEYCYILTILENIRMTIE